MEPVLEAEIGAPILEVEKRSAGSPPGPEDEADDLGLAAAGESSKVRLAKSSITEFEVSALEPDAVLEVEADSSSKEMRSEIFAVGTAAEPPLLGSMLKVIRGMR